jgi:hypothetical protein
VLIFIIQKTIKSSFGYVSYVLSSSIDCEAGRCRLSSCLNLYNPKVMLTINWQGVVLHPLHRRVIII